MHPDHHQPQEHQNLSPALQAWDDRPINAHNENGKAITELAPNEAEQVVGVSRKDLWTVGIDYTFLPPPAKQSDSKSLV